MLRHSSFLDIGVLKKLVYKNDTIWYNKGEQMQFHNKLGYKQISNIFSIMRNQLPLKEFLSKV